MENLEENLKAWNNSNNAASKGKVMDEKAINELIKLKAKKHIQQVFRYFWAFFVFQLIIFGVLSHVMISNNSDRAILMYGSLIMLLYLPFLVTLLVRFKGMASAKPVGVNSHSLKDHITSQKNRIAAFYAFKWKYELILIPVSCALGIHLFFTLYMPGGTGAYPLSAIAVYLASLAACGTAIWRENRNMFKRPIEGLDSMLKELE
ncbi:hypothetical protein [Algoriphagus terrigena]|uniref:hypothetical protein n=1 Tax=Algoriphagus terrigena TaxID=344884 RepID=UPI0004143F41|nr:hypothetical protein [Algoriphagus terrigena]